MVTCKGPRPGSARERLKELGFKLPAPSEPFGSYAGRFRRAIFFFLSGMLPVEGREGKSMGRVGAELDMEVGQKAAYLAALQLLTVARMHSGLLDQATLIVRFGAAVATSGDVRDQPKVAGAASELLPELFGKDKNPCRLVYGS